MKIRGNTVGTTLKPEQAVVKCQNLTEEQKAQARANIGAAKDGENSGDATAKQYELIEDITLTEDANSVYCNVDTNGEKYNFSAVRVFAEVPACGGTGVNHQLCLRLTASGNSWYFYNGIRDGIKATADAATIFMVRNDHGMLDYYGLTSENNDSRYGAVYSSPLRCVQLWKNITGLYLTTYPTSISMLAGTRIRIYGIRG